MPGWGYSETQATSITAKRYRLASPTSAPPSPSAPRRSSSSNPTPCTISSISRRSRNWYRSVFSFVRFISSNFIHCTFFVSSNFIHCTFFVVFLQVTRLNSEGYYGGVRLLMAVCKVFYAYCRDNAIELSDENFTLSYDTDIPRQARSLIIVEFPFTCLLR